MSSWPLYRQLKASALMSKFVTSIWNMCFIIPSKHERRLNLSTPHFDWLERRCLGTNRCCKIKTHRHHRGDPALRRLRCCEGHLYIPGVCAERPQAVYQTWGLAACRLHSSKNDRFVVDFPKNPGFTFVPHKYLHTHIYIYYYIYSEIFHYIYVYIYRVKYIYI